METFSALLALCAGNSPVPVNSPHKGQWRGALMFSLIYAWINDWVSNRQAGDLRRQRDHYDVIVMTKPPSPPRVRIHVVYECKMVHPNELVRYGNIMEDKIKEKRKNWCEKYIIRTTVTDIKFVYALCYWPTKWLLNEHKLEMKYPNFLWMLCILKCRLQNDHHIV